MTARPKAGLGYCHCGSDWFKLTGGDNPPEALPNGGVNIDATGRIQSFSGILVCAACDVPWQPPRARLSVVDGDLSLAAASRSPEGGATDG